MLDFRIDTFLCVCRHLNYTKAAEELNITQPAVSQHIRFLESYYGEKLFDYQNKMLSLTMAGSALKNAMLSMKHDTLYLKKNLKEQKAAIQELNFGATLSIGEYLLSPLLAAYLKKNPHITINYKIANTCQLLSQLDEGSIDFAFVEGNFPKSDYDSLLVKNDPFVGVCGRDYPISGEIPFPELFSHQLLIREDGSGTRKILEHHLTQMGHSLSDFSLIDRLNSPHTILQLLSSGYGISFMYEIVAKKSLAEGSIKKIHIPGFAVEHEMNFIWRKNSIYSSYYKDLFYEIIS